MLSGYVPAAVAKSALISNLPGTNHLQLAIGLPLRNREALTNLLRDIYNPASANYHHYLTTEQFTEQFGPTIADFQALVAFARSNNLVMTNHYHANRMLLDVDGTVADIERAFNVHMGLFRHPTEERNYYAPTTEPSVPAGLAVADISGLNNYLLPRPNFKVQATNAASLAKPGFGSGPGGSYMGADFRAAYVPGVSLTGTGQTVGLLQFDGYYPSDIQEYERQNGLPNVPLVNVYLDGYNGAPTGTDGELEVALDIEMVVSMAPGASQIIVYEGGPFGTPNDILNRMATDNIAKQLSASWSWTGGPQSTTEQIFLEMAAQGQTFCHCSMDSDAYSPGQVDDPNQTYAPASSPNILQVGGTTLSTSGPHGAWTSEKVWNWGNDSGSCGGVSTFYAIPTWQQGIDMTANHGSTQFRNIPDVAMCADNVYVIDQGQGITGVGGTSCASPLWAAFTALVNQQAVANGQPPVGFMNPALYAIGQSPEYALAFHDITVGNNTNSTSPNLFYACPGYDLCTGLGTPSGINLINALAPPELVPVFTVLTNQIVNGNGNGQIDPNECDSMFFVIQNISPITATSVQVSISTVTPGVTVVQSQANLPDIPSNGTVTNDATPFEISISPDFLCGTTVYLTLTFKCDQTTSTRVIALPTGTLGGVVRFDNSTPVPITGANGGTSIINVSNVDSTLMHVAVSAYVLEPFDFGLTLQLTGPDGTTVLLSQNNGGSGQNYGLGCDIATIFDDNAPISILTGQAPFLGSYQPQSPLSVFNGKFGTNVNGGWQLHATDAFGESASIQCWSLLLSSATCLDGGGQCPGVDLALGMVGLPQPVMVGSNLTYTVSVTNLGPDTATGVALTMNLPASAPVVSISSSQGSSQLTGTLLTCNLGTLAVGHVATVTVVVTPSTEGTIYCSASVGTQQQELNSANNSVTVVNRVSPPQADLALSLAANPSPVLLNGLLTYTATIVNHGPSIATNVVLTNTLPLSASYVSARATQGTVANQANLVIANVGTLQVGSNAVVTIQVSPLVMGPITDTATVSSPVSDPVVGNNTVSVNTTVTAAADLAVTITAPPSVIVGSNFTYQVNVQNLGPSTATGVTLRDNVPGNLTVLATNLSQGTITSIGNNLNWSIGSLSANSSATLTITVGTTLISSPTSVVNTVSVTSDQADPYTANNSASVSNLVTFPIVSVVPAGSQLLGESFTPTNGMIDPGETVTMMLRLQNLGNLDSRNLTARLLASGGITPVGNQLGNYGVLTAGGASVSQPFTFTAAQTNGGTVTASLQLISNGTNFTVVSFPPFVLSLTKNFANTNNIIIPDHGPAIPYPSTNIVSGISGIIGKVTVTFTNFNHTYPDDVDMLLVGPGGQNVLLMSHAGSGGLLTNAQLTFDSGATSANGNPALLPSSSPIISGAYQPSQYGTVDFTDNFNGTITISTNHLPPAPPYRTNLDIFNGTQANGAWLLYVFDSSPGDQGIIVGGWSLAITSGTEINPVVDLAVSGKATPNPVLEGNNLTYTFTVTNVGPNVASVVQFTNALPANSTFVSATNSAQVPCAINANGDLSCTFTNLAAGASITVTVVVTPNAGGALASTATVTGSDSDPNQSNNSATVTTTVNAPVADLAVTMSGAPNAITGSNVLYVITVTNNGPGTAFGVLLTDPTMGVLSLGSGSSSGATVTNGAITVKLGNLDSGAGAVVNLFLSSTQALTVTNTVTVATGSSDPNPINNTASVVTVFSAPAPSIIAGTPQFVSGPANGSIVPGQTATVSLPLINVGTADTTNLVATLLATNGVTPSSLISYGVLAHGGGTAAKSFTFTANGSSGGIVTATLLLADGNNNLGTVSFPFNLPATNTFANTGAIIIPDHGPASPYPAVISVSNVAGVVSKATVTLSNYNHQFPNDVEVLLVAPSGQNLVLMAGAGGGSAVTNLVLTFDDAAGSSLPATSQFNTASLVSGTFLPTDNGLALDFPNPAPATPTGSALSSLTGVVANGNWALYVLDNSSGDSGTIVNGWSLSLSSISPINSVADLGVGLTLPGGLIYPGNLLAITVDVTNKGPAAASNVTITNTLTPGLNFVSTSLDSYFTANGAYVFNIGSIASGSSTNFTISVNPTAGGVYSSAVRVGADQTDMNLQDNVTQANLQVQNPPRLGAKFGSLNGGAALTLSVMGPPGTYQILASTNLSLSLSNWTTVATTSTLSSSFQFTDTNASKFPQRYYRVILVP